MKNEKLYAIGCLGLLLSMTLITGCGSSDDGDRGSGSDETFSFLAEQKFTPDLGTDYLVESGDINGDGNDDIILADMSLSSRGRFAVAFSNGDGTFKPLEYGELSTANSVLGKFHLLIGDIDADGSEDIILMALNKGTQANYLYAAFYKSSSSGPGFVYSAEQSLSYVSGLYTFTPRMGQMDGRRGVDIILNNVPMDSATTNRSYILRAVDMRTIAAGFDLSTDTLFSSAVPIDHPDINWNGIEHVHIADFNGDGRDDILWQDLDTIKSSYNVGLGTSTGGLDFRPFHVLYQGTWANYVSLAGDANGDGVADLIHASYRKFFEDSDVYFGSGVEASSGNVISDLVPDLVNITDDVAIIDLFGSKNASSPFRIKPDLYLADVDGDGSKDLIINDKGHGDPVTNNIGVGLSTFGGSDFTYTRKAQTVTGKADWTEYNKTIIADVNGDGREDILWINSGAIYSVYVGLAR